MPETILGASWYKVPDIARALSISIEEAEAIMRQAIASGRYPIAFHTSPMEPEINGYTLMELAGRRLPPQYKPTTRRRRR